jgi:DNA invertase Pin-like site-specific DNA recombinase
MDLAGERRALAYIRVSTGEQAESGAGLAAQRKAVTDEVARRGWLLQEVIEDAGYSAATLDRPGLTDALQRLDGRKADVLVVSKLDRLSRSVGDFSTLVDRSRRRGWQLVLMDLGLDTTTAAGELVANVVASTSQYERRLIGIRTREALAAKKAAGVRLGRPSNLPQQVLLDILEQRRTGRTFAAITRSLNDRAVPTSQGGVRWYAATVRSVLNSQAVADLGNSDWLTPHH